MMVWTRSSTAQRTLIGTLALCGLLIAAAAAFVDVNSSSCPFDAIAVEPGNSIQAAVDFAGDGAVFCLKKGIHRAQAVRPRAGQRFYGEGANRSERQPAAGQLQARGATIGWRTANSSACRKHGECLPSAPTCDQPQAVFIDDKPLTRVLSKDALASNEVLHRLRRRQDLSRRRSDEPQGRGDGRVICIREHCVRRVDQQPHGREVWERRAKRARSTPVRAPDGLSKTA